MKRVLVIGCCGAGKSTFSRKLNALTGLPLIHLDQEYWNANWVETKKEIWEPKVKELVKRDTWIIDGNYGSTLDPRLERADTIFYLDFSTAKCLWRVTKRVWKYHGTERPDMPLGCKERFDLEFFHFVATYNFINRKGIYEKLEEYKKGKNIHIFKNDKQSENLLNSLR